MSDKENYFPPNTPIDVIKDVLYTDFEFLRKENNRTQNNKQTTKKGK